MPLLDHFHAPLYPQRHWEAFHSRWAGAIADALNADLLPPDYFAEPETHASGRVEIDVATFEATGEDRAGGGLATATLPTRIWSAPPAAISMPCVFPGAFRVRVFRNEGGAVLVGAIELVSPGNKDRGEERRAFAAKCANYLYEGVSLVILDVVTSRHGNLHNEIVDLMQCDSSFHFGGEESLYAVGYRPVRRDSADVVDLWPRELSLGQPLPTLPLYLRGDVCVPIELDATYNDASRRLRLN
jgi:uncharacterized protein DUF4058